jgi:hypothetical protein
MVTTPATGVTQGPPSDAVEHTVKVVPAAVEGVAEVMVDAFIASLKVAVLTRFINKPVA